MTSLLETWERLIVDGDTGAEFVRLRLPELKSCVVYAARSLEADLEAVILEVDTESIPANAEYPDARGLTVRVVALAPGRSGRTRIILSLTNDQYRDVFHTLAEDVVSKLLEARDETEAVRLFVARLSRWQTFLRRHGNHGLSQEERRGLIGELFLLRNHLLTRWDQESAISSWKGCRGANHDFQFLLGSIEVKTTSSNTPHSFHVANIRQLDSPGQGQLFVFFVLVEENEAGNVSLPEVIDSLRIKLEGVALEAFEDNLVEAGYLENQKQNYSSPRYSIRRERFFRVDEDFPRLLEESLPSGVEEVRYQVAIAACTPFEVFPPDVVCSILGWPGESE